MKAANVDERVSVIIPTLNPGNGAPKLINALRRQRIQPLEIVVIDSASIDGSPQHWRDAGFKVLVIARSDFNHGGTRNMGARQAQGAILVFMTQDAIPTDEQWLENLIAPIVSGEATATYARQIPREDATLLECFARNFNYPPVSKLKVLADVRELGYKAFFFSNVCSAVRADVFWAMGGFPERVIMNEDGLFCAKLLQAGHKVKYTAEAQVYHSHNYSLLQQFRRNFDMGVSIGRVESLLKGAPTGGAGLRFVEGQARYVVEAGSYLSLFKVLAEAAVKLTAFSLGKRERWLPYNIKRYFSMHKSFWIC